MLSFAVGVDALSDDALELEFASTKKKLLDLDVYRDELRYRKLFERLEAVLARILARHQHLALNVEGKHDALERALLFSGGRSNSSGTLRASSKLNMHQVDS